MKIVVMFGSKSDANIYEPLNDFKAIDARLRCSISQLFNSPTRYFSLEEASSIFSKSVYLINDKSRLSVLKHLGIH